MPQQRADVAHARRQVAAVEVELRDAADEVERQAAHPFVDRAVERAEAVGCADLVELPPGAAGDEVDGAARCPRPPRGRRRRAAVPVRSRAAARLGPGRGSTAGLTRKRPGCRSPHGARGLDPTSSRRSRWRLAASGPSGPARPQPGRGPIQRASRGPSRAGAGASRDVRARPRSSSCTCSQAASTRSNGKHSMPSASTVGCSRRPV